MVNIKLTDNLDEANCITHSGRFHIDDVMATVFLSKIKNNIILCRVDSIKSDENLQNKIVYDIGLRRV